MSSLGSVALSGVGASRPIAIGQNFAALTSPVNIGMVAALSAGAVLTYSAQITCDGVNWVDHDVLTALSASKYGNIAYAVTGVRLNVTSWTSGTVTLGVAQWP